MKVYIFDMDGTFINSMDYWNNLMVNYLSSKGLQAYDGLATEVLSMTLDDGVKFIKNKYELESDCETIIKELEELMNYQYTNSFNIDPKAREIFKKLKERGDKLVLATATQRSLTNIVLDRFGLRDLFDLEIVSDEIDLHKSDVQYFDKIVDYFEVEPEECVVIEDALYSMKTAKKVGMKVVAIISQTPQCHIDEILSISNRSGNNLEEVEDYILGS